MRRDSNLMWGDLIFTVFLLSVGGFAYHHAMGMTSGTWYSPSIFPRLSSGLMMVLCLFHLGRIGVEIRAAVKEGSLGLPSLGVLSYALKPSVVFMMAAVLAFAVALPIARFAPSTFLFLLVTMTFYSGRFDLKAMLVYALISLGFVVFSVLVFKTVFKVLLP